jgi:outer membrane protein
MALISVPVAASESAVSLVPLVSEIDYTNEDGWGGAVGFKFESLATYKGSDQSALELKLDGAVQWRSGDQVLFWENFDINTTEFGWKGRLNNNWLLKVGARHETVLPSGKTAAAGIENFPHRGSHLLGFVESKHALDHQWSSWLAAKMLTGPSSYGVLIHLSAGHNIFQSSGNTGLELMVFTTLATETNINNYFGITESDSAASGLDAVNLSGGYRSAGAGLFYRKKVSDNIQLSANAQVEYYNSDFSKSDLLTHTSETHSELAILWKF